MSLNKSTIHNPESALPEKHKSENKSEFLRVLSDLPESQLNALCEIDFQIYDGIGFGDEANVIYFKLENAVNNLYEIIRQKNNLLEISNEDTPKHTKSQMIGNLSQLSHKQLNAILNIKNQIDLAVASESKVDLQNDEIGEAIDKLHKIKRQENGMVGWPSQAHDQREMFKKMGIGFDPDEYDDLTGIEVVWTDPTKPMVTELGIINSAKVDLSPNGQSKNVYVVYPPQKENTLTSSWKLKFVNAELAESKRKNSN